ncbi:MAG: electron transport complex protein RnfA [Oscillospiraceae bacterium]|nr:electron transport complex protein RnfA [Oscillospiraceae bacterium]
MKTGDLQAEETAKSSIIGTLFVILIAGVLTENFILSKFLGICPFLGVSKTMQGAVGMGLAVTLTMLMATALTFPIYVFVLVPLEISYMTTIAFILVIALFVQLLEMLLKKFLPPLYEALGMYLPLIITNCAILGVTVLNVNRGYNFGYALFNSLCAGLGFLIVMLVFSTIRERVEQNQSIPEPLKGAPITLISAAIMSLALIGFGGLGG